MILLQKAENGIKQAVGPEVGRAKASDFHGLS